MHFSAISVSMKIQIDANSVELLDCQKKKNKKWENKNIKNQIKIK